MKKDFAWKLKNSWFCFLSIIPFLQFVPFFIMNGRIPKKRWILLAFANIAIGIAVILITTFGNAYGERNRARYPEGKPDIKDYLGEKYYDDKDYKERPEYAQYKEAENAWMSTPEYIEYTEENREVLRVSQSIDTTAMSLFFISWFIFAILCIFVERYRFMRELSALEDKAAVYQQLSQQTAPQPTPPYHTKAPDASHDTANSLQAKASSLANAPAQHKININTADEAEFLQLPLLKTLDVKKILAYRNTNGTFKTIDEFFASFDAKPHVIVKIKELITLNSPRSFDDIITSPVQGADTPAGTSGIAPKQAGGARFDL